MSFLLRDYQLEAANKVCEELQRVRSTCVIWATGLGKSTLAAEIIRRWYPQRCMFVCERKELVDQAAERIFDHTGIQCGIERGEHRINPDDLYEDGNRPIVASIQSLNSKWGLGKRMHKFKPALVIVDEFHHSAAPSYEKFFNYVGPETKLLGLSATPKRLDGKSLGKHFETIAHQMELQEAIQKGWLCDIAQEYVQIKGLDLSKIRTVRQDLDPTQLREVLEPEEMVQRICQPSLEIIFGVERGSLASITPDKWGDYLREKGHAPFRTIMFCASVNQARLASEVMNRASRGLSDWIAATTSIEERPQKMQAFREGSIPVITNCAILGEGVDVPQVEVILQARPTKSLSLWIQQLGRGTRTLPGVLNGCDTVEQRLAAIAGSGKRFVRVVDYVGNSGRHKLISSIDVLGGEMTEEVKKKALSVAIAKGKPVAMSVTLTNAQKELDRQKAEAKKRLEELKKQHLNAAVEYSTKKVDPFSNTPGQTTFWKSNKGAPATEKQRNALGSLGVYPHGWTKKQASMLIAAAHKNKEAGKGWKLPPDMEWAKKRKPQ